MALNFPAIALQVPAILLPRAGTDLTRWAVVACDQYTSQPEYWERARAFVGEAPSTLKLILPEVYLETPQEEGIIRSINEAMRRYLAEGILAVQRPGFVLVDRQTRHAGSRKGLVVALDLECYDYSKGAQTLIRATEGTILERLPPRVRVRQDAPLELPHIMVLIDDPERTVIEPLVRKALTPLYDVELMAESGRVKGFLVDREEDQRAVAAALEALAQPEAFGRRSGVDGEAVLLYAMGDGNHSFATAKAIWERLKQEAGGIEPVREHPARHALVELVNIHDQGLVFEPIHRVLFGVQPAALEQAAQAFFAGQGSKVAWRPCADAAAAKQAAADPALAAAHAIPCVGAEGWRLLVVETPARSLVVATLQEFLDSFLATHAGIKIDFIHGEDVVAGLGSKPGNMGFSLPAIDKRAFFRTIVRDGALPRKTFSMGEADEKRFYLECRRIRPA